MKAEIFLENTTQAKEIVEALEPLGIQKSSIVFKAKSRSQIDSFMRLQRNASDQVSLDTRKTVVSTSAIFSLVALIAVLYSAPNTSLGVKLLSVLLAATIGAFLSYVASQFKFQYKRKYKLVEVETELPPQKNLEIEFQFNKNKRTKIERVVSAFNPLELNFSD